MRCYNINFPDAIGLRKQLLPGRERRAASAVRRGYLSRCRPLDRRTASC